MECRVGTEPAEARSALVGEMVCPRAWLVSDCNRFGSRNPKRLDRVFVQLRFKLFCRAARGYPDGGVRVYVGVGCRVGLGDMSAGVGAIVITRPLRFTLLNGLLRGL